MAKFYERFILMLEIWHTSVDLSTASGGPCIAKLQMTPSSSVTPLMYVDLRNFLLNFELNPREKSSNF